MKMVPKKKTPTDVNSPITRQLKILKKMCCTHGVRKMRPLRNKKVRRKGCLTKINVAVSKRLPTAKKQPSFV
eukprot:1076706-Amphidinium_carterae.1